MMPIQAVRKKMKNKVTCAIQLDIYYFMSILRIYGGIKTVKKCVIVEKASEELSW